MRILPITQPITEIIHQRFSCRSYLAKPVASPTRKLLADFMDGLQVGPLGTRSRFRLVSATEEDRNSLRGMGTYGFIRDAAGFILGATNLHGKSLEDFGFMMESIILTATSLGLGTCWLGGTFTKSSFSRKIGLEKGEVIPAATAIGYIADPDKARNGFIRQQANSLQRRSWERLFFDKQFGSPLLSEEAGTYAIPLEMVRIGPSASNKQPWCILKDDNAWHFYLRRTPGYRQGIFQVLLDLVDLQRMDMGIAMCHFALTAAELGLKGEWNIHEPAIAKPDELTEYTVSWLSEDK